MSERKLMAMGGSLVLCLPRSWCRDLRLGPGDTVDVLMEGGKLVVMPGRLVAPEGKPE